MDTPLSKLHQPDYPPLQKPHKDKVERESKSKNYNFLDEMLSKKFKTDYFNQK